MLRHDPHFRTVLELLLLGGPEVPEQSRAITRLGFEAWLDSFEEVLAEAHARGELRLPVSPRSAAQAVLALAVGLTTSAVHAAQLLTADDATAALVDVLLKGVADEG